MTKSAPKRVRIDARPKKKTKRRKPRTVELVLVFSAAGFMELDTRARSRSMRLGEYVRALIAEDADDVGHVARNVRTSVRGYARPTVAVLPDVLRAEVPACARGEEVTVTWYPQRPFRPTMLSLFGAPGDGGATLDADPFELVTLAVGTDPQTLTPVPLGAVLGERLVMTAAQPGIHIRAVLRASRPAAGDRVAGGNLFLHGESVVTREV